MTNIILELRIDECIYEKADILQRLSYVGDATIKAWNKKDIIPVGKTTMLAPWNVVLIRKDINFSNSSGLESEMTNS